LAVGCSQISFVDMQEISGLKTGLSISASTFFLISACYVGAVAVSHCNRLRKNSLNKLAAVTIFKNSFSIIHEEIERQRITTVSGFYM
jgi:hypothetical protein